MVVTAIIPVGSVLGLGVLFLRLRSLPERVAHRGPSSVCLPCSRTYTSSGLPPFCLHSSTSPILAAFLAASPEAAEERISTLLPAEKASAEAALKQAQVELDKTVIRAGVSGRVEQFFLRVGDIVNPFIRPTGVFIPAGAGTQALQAGFGQVEAQLLKVGMIAEVTCVSKPFTILPMVVTAVQNYTAAGQFRGGEQLVDL